MTLSGRYNLAQITIADGSGTAPKLNSENRFSRFNPAIGINFNPRSHLTTYASYNEGMRALSVTARYSYIDATYQSRFVENSRVNSAADAAGVIQVNRGNRLSGIPRHNLKLRFDYAFDERTSVGSNVMLTGASFARGDENKQGVRGKVPGYVVVNLNGRFQMTKEIELFARANNVFDRQYANFGILGRNAFAGAEGRFDPADGVGEQFRGYGAPRGIWVGMRLNWK